MNTEIITLDDLKDVFYSGYPAAIAWDVIDELYIAIHEDVLTYKRYAVSSIDHYHHLVDSAIIAEGLGPQEAGHMALKAVACEWLDKEYGTKADAEIYFAGLHPNIISSDRRYVIECGTTDPGCIVMYLSEPGVLLAGNIAYPFSEDTNVDKIFTLSV